MKCPTCEFDNPEGMKFCGGCGAPLVGHCPSCGTVNPPHFKFCGECGESLAGETPDPAAVESQSIPKPSKADKGSISTEAERRQLTVMFCDLVGSTELSGKLDPEDMATILRAYQDACTSVVKQYGGYVARFMGDGVLVYFGYPRAHEDDAERAIYTGLGIVESIGELERPVDVDKPLAVRIGIATGRVVVGDVIGEESSQETVVTGETPNLAARLQGLAEANTIVISVTTHELLGDLFSYADMGDHVLKGFPDPVHAWRVIGEGRIEMRFEARSGEHIPMVGRDEELELLLRRWQSAKDGEGQVTLISGEPGIGKSLLVDTLRERVVKESHFRLRYQCSPLHTNSSLFPLVTRLERAAGFDRGDSPDIRLTKLESLLGKSGTPPAETVALLAELLSIPPSDRYPKLNLEPSQQKRRTLEVLIEQAMQLSKINPILFIFEDVQWADPTSLEFLDLIVDFAPTAAIDVIITFRPEFNAHWEGQAHTTSMILNRISESDSRKMVEQLAKEIGLPEAIVNEIVNKADGVPTFIEELTRTIIDTARKGVERELDFSAASIPSTLQDSLMARLDGLEVGKSVAQMAAVLGREFGLMLLSKISDLSKDKLDIGLGELENTSLLFRRGAGSEVAYNFKHALIHDTAYHSLLRTRRHELHARTANVLETDFPDVVSTQPELLAHHHIEAGAFEQALEYWLRAGHRSAGQAAYREAATSFEQGLIALGQLPESHETLEQEIDLHFEIRSSLQALGEHEQVFEHLHDAEALATTLGDRDRLGWSSAYLSQYLWWKGDPTRAEKLGKRAQSMASELNDFALEAVATFFLGQGNFNTGNYHNANDHLLRNVAFLKDGRAHERLGLTGLPSVLSRVWLAWSLAEQGEFTEAMVHAKEAQSIAEAADQPYSVAAACLGVGQVQLVQGGFSQSIPVLERAKGLCENWHLHVIAPMVSAVLGLSNMMCGRVDEALATVEESEAVAPSFRIFDSSSSTIALGTGYLMAGRFDEASAIASQVSKLAVERGFRGNEARALHLQGEISAHRDPPEMTRADDHYRQALGLADELGMRPLVAHSHLGLGRAHRRDGNGPRAEEHFASALALYGDMDMQFWQDQTEASADVDGKPESHLMNPG